MKRETKNGRVRLAFSLRSLSVLLWIFPGTIVSTTVPLTVAMLLPRSGGGSAETIVLGSICLLMIGLGFRSLQNGGAN